MSKLLLPMPCWSTHDRVLSRLTTAAGFRGVAAPSCPVSAVSLVGLTVGEEEREEIVAGVFAALSLSTKEVAWTLVLEVVSVPPFLSLPTEDLEGRADADFEERSKLGLLRLAFPFPFGVAS